MLTRGVTMLVQRDGTEEVIACSWDGHTYFINLSKAAVRVHSDENVTAFCAGVPTINVVVFGQYACFH